MDILDEFADLKRAGEVAQGHGIGCQPGLEIE